MYMCVYSFVYVICWLFYNASRRSRGQTPCRRTHANSDDRNNRNSNNCINNSYTNDYYYYY